MAIEDEIKELEKLNERDKAKIASHLKDAGYFQTALTNCSKYKLKKKRQQCEHDNDINRKLEKTNRDAAAKLQKGVDARAKDISALRDAQAEQEKAKAESEIILANKGVSRAQLEIVATGTADAAKKEAEGAAAAAMADAEGRTQALMLETEKTSSGKMFLYIGVGLVVVLIGGFFAYTKFKKK